MVEEGFNHVRVHNNFKIEGLKLEQKAVSFINFHGWILVELCLFLFVVTQIKSLSEQKIVEIWL